jgi:hypothetical protein
MWKYSQTYEYAVVDPSGQTKKESAWCKFFKRKEMGFADFARPL